MEFAMKILKPIMVLAFVVPVSIINLRSIHTDGFGLESAGSCT